MKKKTLFNKQNLNIIVNHYSVSISFFHWSSVFFIDLLLLVTAGQKFHLWREVATTL